MKQFMLILFYYQPPKKSAFTEANDFFGQRIDGAVVVSRAKSQLYIGPKQ